jgi:hypothetical protein
MWHTAAQAEEQLGFEGLCSMDLVSQSVSQSVSQCVGGKTLFAYTPQGISSIKRLVHYRNKCTLVYNFISLFTV